MGSPDYTPLPRESTDSNSNLYIASNPNEHNRTSTAHPLFPSSKTTRNFHLTINYILILRIISLSISIPAFTLFIQHGRKKYIAADIFLMLLIIFNTIRILHLFISSLFKLTIEITRGDGDSEWQSRISVQPNGPRATNVMDCLLTLGLGFAMIGGMVKNSRNEYLVAPIVLAFVTLALQTTIALPIKNQTFLVKFHYQTENSYSHSEASLPTYNVLPRDEPQRQMPEDLV